MTSTLIDSNVFLDVIGDDTRWRDWSAEKLSAAAERGVVVLNPIVYAETSPRFVDYREFDLVVATNRVTKEDLPWQAAHLAGQAHLLYRRRGGTRERTLPDFLIGAHAFVKEHTLLTRDARRYREYFPDLDIIAPDTHP